MSEVTLTCACERTLQQVYERNEKGYRTSKWECECGDPRPYSKEEPKSYESKSLEDLYKFFLPDGWDGLELKKNSNHSKKPGMDIATSDSFTITLPTASSNSGKQFVFKGAGDKNE